jgi:transposase
LTADLLRTDQKRYAVWNPDQPLTRQIRAEVRFAHQIGRELVRDGNRLRSILLRYYPASLKAFPHLDSLVFLAFLQTYLTPGQAQALDFDQLTTFLREHHHSQTRSWPNMDAAYSPLTLAQARILEMLVRSRSECLARLGKLYLQRPDREIYDSLPQTGALLAPALLSKLGDDRNRYPNTAILQAVAGTCPVTNRSGKHSHVHFRTACDHEFRYIAQQWARLTLEASPWAAT